MCVFVCVSECVCMYLCLKCSNILRFQGYWRPSLWFTTSHQSQASTQTHTKYKTNTTRGILSVGGGSCVRFIFVHGTWSHNIMDPLCFTATSAQLHILCIANAQLIEYFYRDFVVSIVSLFIDEWGLAHDVGSLM